MYKKCKIAKIMADKGRKHFYYSLGLRPNNYIFIFLRCAHGVIIYCQNTKIALTNDAFSKIELETEEK